MNDDFVEWWRLDYPIHGLSQPVKRLISQIKVEMPKKDRSSFRASVCIEVSLAKKVKMPKKVRSSISAT